MMPAGSQVSDARKGPLLRRSPGQNCPVVIEGQGVIYPVDPFTVDDIITYLKNKQLWGGTTQVWSQSTVDPNSSRKGFTAFFWVRKMLNTQVEELMKKPEDGGLYHGKVSPAVKTFGIPRTAVHD